MNIRYLTINSIDRENFETTSNFSIKVTNGLLFNSAKLIFCQIPNTYYNITESNNKIIINNFTVEMTPGNYNLDEFFNEFSNNIDETISGISFNDVSGILNFTLTNNLNVRFPSSGSMHSVLGFPKNYNVTSNSHNSSFPPSLAKHIVYLDVSEFSSNHGTSDEQSGSFTWAINNNVNKNDIILFNEKTNYNQIINCKDYNKYVYKISVKVKDINNQIVQGLGEFVALIQFF